MHIWWRGDWFLQVVHLTRCNTELEMEVYFCDPNPDPVRLQAVQFVFLKLPDIKELERLRQFLGNTCRRVPGKGTHICQQRYVVTSIRRRHRTKILATHVTQNTTRSHRQEQRHQPHMIQTDHPRSAVSLNLHHARRRAHDKSARAARRQLGEQHWEGLRQALAYIKQTADFGLWYQKQQSEVSLDRP